MSFGDSDNSLNAKSRSGDNSDNEQLLDKKKKDKDLPSLDSRRKIAPKRRQDQKLAVAPKFFDSERNSRFQTELNSSTKTGNFKPGGVDRSILTEGGGTPIPQTAKSTNKTIDTENTLDSSEVTT